MTNPKQTKIAKVQALLERRLRRNGAGPLQSHRLASPFGACCADRDTQGRSHH